MNIKNVQRRSKYHILSSSKLSQISGICKREPTPHLFVNLNIIFLSSSSYYDHFHQHIFITLIITFSLPPSSHHDHYKISQIWKVRGSTRHLFKGHLCQDVSINSILVFVITLIINLNNTIFIITQPKHSAKWKWHPRHTCVLLISVVINETWN